MNCKACGTALPEGALFCGECGRPVDVPAFESRPRIPVPVAATALQFSSEPDPTPPSNPVTALADSEYTCPQCGEPVDDDDVFCGECGFVLSVSEPRPPLSSFAPILPSSHVDVSIENDAAAEPDREERFADVRAAVEDEVAPVEAAPVEVSPVEVSPVEVSPVEVSPVEVVAPLGAVEAEPVAEAEPELVAAVESDPVFVEPEVSTGKIVVPPRDALFGGPSPEKKPLRQVPDPFPWGKDSRGESIDLEATRIVAGALPEERFVLQFSTGESVTVSGAGLVGRNPASQPGEFVDQLVTIFDAGKSVSKTHLEFGQDSGRFWVSDRYSTNGSTVRQPDLEAKRCEPGRRYFVARGTRVDIGEQFFVVS